MNLEAQAFLDGINCRLEGADPKTSLYVGSKLELAFLEGYRFGNI